MKLLFFLLHSQTVEHSADFTVEDDTEWSTYVAALFNISFYYTQAFLTSQSKQAPGEKTLYDILTKNVVLVWKSRKAAVSPVN